MQQQTKGLGSFVAGYAGSYIGNLFHGRGLQGSYDHIAAETEAEAMANKIDDDLLSKYGTKAPCDKPCEVKK